MARNKKVCNKIRSPGPLAEALANLQTVVDHAAATIGEDGSFLSTDDNGESGEKKNKEKEKEDIDATGAIINRGFRAMEQVENDCGGFLDPENVTGREGDKQDATINSEERRSVTGRSFAEDADAAVNAKNQSLGLADGGDGDFELARVAAGAPTATAAGAACVTWHPASGRLMYAEGGGPSLFAEDLNSCRRWLLVSSACGGGGSRSDRNMTTGEERGRAVLAVSADGGLVARGSPTVRQQASGGVVAAPSANYGNNKSSSSLYSHLSVWSLGPDMPESRSLLTPPSGGGEENRPPRCAALTAVVEARDAEDGVVSLAFSPCGSELCSVGGWNGNRCMLKIRPTTLDFSYSSPVTTVAVSGTVSGVPANTNAAVSITTLSAKTSVICVLPDTVVGFGGGENHNRGGSDESFVFVTGGEEGLAMWRRVRGSGSGGGNPEGGVWLLGTSEGVRATALAVVGQFVVAAELCGVDGRMKNAESLSSITVVDARWLAAGGYQGTQKTSEVDDSGET